MQSRNSKNSQGIDVSKWQGTVQWAKVKNTNTKFVIMKATEGTTTVDSKLTTNYAGAKSVGIPLGFYHFAHVSNDPIQEAEHYLKNVKNFQPELWHVLDMEQGSLDNKNFSKSQVSTWTRKWLDKVESVTGKVPMIYTGASFARTYFESDLAKYPLWVAHYGTDTPMSNPVWNNWTVFQYSESGYVDGISGYVDLNELNGDISEYLKQDIVGDENEMKLTLNEWKMLGDSIDGWYRKGLISDYGWAEKAYRQELTLSELTWLNSIVFTRQNGIEV